MGYQSGLRAYFAHGLTASDDENIVAYVLGLSTDDLFALAKALVDDRIQFSFLKGFGEVIVCPEAHGLHDFFRIVDAGKHYDLYARTLLAKLLERLETIDCRHQNVEQHQVKLHAFVDALQSFFASGSGFHFVVVDLEQGSDVAE